MRKIRGNDEFSRWWNRWSVRLQRIRMPNGQISPREKMDSVNEQNSHQGELKRSPMGRHDKAS